MPTPDPLMAPLKGHHALVTGAGSGIGAAIARTLAAAGARVTLAGRRLEPLETLAAEIGAGVHVRDGFDVTRPAAIAVGLEAARAAFGPVSILVNNAGEAPSAPFEKTTGEMWAQVIGVDLTGVFNVTQAVLPDLKARGEGARIVNVASTAGLTGYAYVSAYCAAKHGVIGLTRALALELAKKGVTVNAVCPGFTDTPIIRRAIATIVEKNRPQCRGSAGRVHEIQPARAPRSAAGGGRHRALARLAGRRFRHRPGDRGRRRRDHGRVRGMIGMCAFRKDAMRAVHPPLSCRTSPPQGGRAGAAALRLLAGVCAERRRRTFWC